MKQLQKNDTQEKSRGIAAMEFAVCLPILLVLIVGTIEACSMVYLKQSLSIAAYEGVRTSIKPGATVRDVKAACRQILRSRKVRGGKIIISPSDFYARPVRSWISIRVRARGRKNSIISGWFYESLFVDGTATMMKEF